MDDFKGGRSEAVGYYLTGLIRLATALAILQGLVLLVYPATWPLRAAVAPQSASSAWPIARPELVAQSIEGLTWVTFGVAGALLSRRIARWACPAWTRCSQCGYDCKGLATCPECGAGTAAGAQERQPPPTT